MIHLEDDIKKAIDKMLNDNSYGVEFDVNLYTYSKAPNFINNVFDETSYDVDRQKYIATMIEDIEGNYEDVPKLDMINPAIMISFMIPTSQTTIDYDYIRKQPNFRSFMSALEEVRRNNTTKVIPLGDKGWWLKEGSSFTVEDDTADVELLEFAVKCLDKEQENNVIQGSDFQFNKTSTTLRFVIDGVTTTFDYDEGQYLNFKLYKDNGQIKIEQSDYDGEVIEEKTVNRDTLPNSITFNPYQGYFYYIGIGEENSSYNAVLIEDFDTLENQVESDWEIDKEDLHGAIPFGHNGDLTFTFSTPKPASQGFQHGTEGITHMLFDYYLDTTYTKDTFLGNHYKYYIDGIEIFPLSRNHAYSGETDAEQKIMGNTTKSKTSDNILANTFSTYHKNNKKINEMSRNYLSEDVEQNKVWKLKIDYPTHNEEYDVIIKSFGGQSDYNVPVLLSFEVELEG